MSIALDLALYSFIFRTCLSKVLLKHLAQIRKIFQNFVKWEFSINKEFVQIEQGKKYPKYA